jgi:intraflagellar transport protein 88
MVLDWLGSYYIEHQVAEKALGYFERAALMQPNEVKWQLMSASCHRRSGNYHQALQAYKDIHARFPENIECEYHIMLQEVKKHNIIGTECCS